MRYAQRERVRLVLVHEFAQTPVGCAPGEEAVGAYLIWRGRAYEISLSAPHLVFLDFLCRHRWIAMDASTIAIRMRTDLFVLHHGSNAPGHQVKPSRSSRTAIRQQVRRIRAVIAKVIADEKLDLDAFSILRSEETSTRSKRYRITADVSYEHWKTSRALLSSRSVAGISLPDPDYGDSFTVPGESMPIPISETLVGAKSRRPDDDIRTPSDC
jgi:hypothetical protein